MPRKPKKPCAHPGCPNLTDGRYCPQHEPLHQEEIKEYNRRYNKYNRDPEVMKAYGITWRKIRAAYVAANPLCEECLKHNILTPVEEVHHILPIKQGGTHSFDNLMSLCHSCHEKIERSIGNR